MPCTSCNNIFMILPCKHSDGNLDMSSVSITKHISRHSADDFKKTVIKLYKSLHDDCPCIECLVKVICRHGVKCSIYHDLLVEAAQHDKRNRGKNNAM
jgi:hypothetical protein